MRKMEIIGEKVIRLYPRIYFAALVRADEVIKNLQRNDM